MLIRKRKSEGNYDLSQKETDDDKMNYRLLINYTECADREETKKRKEKKKRKEIVICCEEEDDDKAKYHFLIS